MRYKKLCLNGQKLDAFPIVMGSVPFGTAMDEATARDVLDAYVQMGGNVLDTARVYGAPEQMGAAERVIGRWMEQRGNRAKIILSTKGGHPPLSDMGRGRLDRASLTEDLNGSLDALRTDCIDLYFLHRDDTSRPVGDILETLNGFVGAGRVRALGASNWTPARIIEANAYAREHGLIGFSLNQPRWSLAAQLTVEDPTLCVMDKETYQMHRVTDMPCMPFSSQAKGFFTKLAQNGEGALSDKVRRRFLGGKNLQIFERLQALGAETGASVGALALAFLTSQPFPVFPIVGVSRVSQVEPLREAAQTELTPKHLQSLMALTDLL